MNTVTIKQTDEDQYMLIIRGHHIENKCDVVEGGSAVMIPVKCFVDMAELGSTTEPFNGTDGTNIMLNISDTHYIFSEEVACMVFEAAENCLWDTVDEVTDSVEEYEVAEDEEGNLYKQEVQQKPMLTLV